MKISLSAKQQKILEFILVLAIVTVISISTLSAANPALNPPGRDGGFFMYVGKAIKSGAKLYADIWDSKGPLIFWINALGVGRDFSRWGLFLIEIVFGTFSLFVAYFAIKQKYGKIPALVTILLGSYLLSHVIGPGNSVEEYSLLFTWISIAALVSLVSKPEKPFLPFSLMGATIVLNFLLRANNIGTQSMVIVVALIYAFTKRKEIKFWQVFCFLIIGALAIIIPVSVYFIVNGTFKAMIDASVLYNFAYSTARGNPFSNSLIPGINVFSRWFYIISAIWLIALIRFIFLLTKKAFDSFLLLTLLAFPVEIVMSSISGRGFTHYFICWIPAMMLLLAFAFERIQQEVVSKKFRELVEKKRSVLSLVLLLIIILISTFSPFYSAARYIRSSILYPDWQNDYREPIAKVLEKISSEDDEVLVFGGQAGINIMAKRDSVDYAPFYPSINNSKLGLEIQKKYFDTLRTSKPKIILDGHQLYPQFIPAIDPHDRENQTIAVPLAQNLDKVLDWINENYYRYDEANGYIIFMLKEDMDL